MSFREIKPEDLSMNPFTKIGKEWLLITAGNEEKCNTMTASWGSMGVMWGKNAVTVYIRPQRYTKEFVDRDDTFTVSVLGETYRKALNYCGTVSGRGIDKMKEAGLTPYYVDGTAGIGEADLIMVCKKMYHDTIKPECFDEAANDGKWYPEKDYHTMYIAEIIKVLVKES
ncbi:MAG: flavin reductase family protein [Eubacteriales bacterium]|nr:flavin reductase family protein [Eubacteriales bacterium]